MSKIRILGTGVATMDIYPGKRRMYPGGNEYNVVCNAVLRGAEAGFLGVFANDSAGEILESTLTGLGVDVSRSHHERGSSGYSLVELKPDGDRIFLEWNQQGVTDLYPISFTEDEIAYVKTFDVITMGRVACVTPATIRRLHEQHQIPICYDFHAAFTEGDLEEIAPHIQYGFFSCSHLGEEEICQVLKRAVDLGCAIAIGTRGCDPVMAYDGQRYYRHIVDPVETVDALGAGDSFIAAFLVSYLGFSGQEQPSQEKVRQALKDAADHAATVVVKEGSIGVGFDFAPPHLKEVINIG